jgi:putative (di)nucleoside polyphosphate hydrolase
MQKVFAYVVRSRGPTWELLGFATHEEEVGYEVPKGAVESGETPVEAAQRELHEETGIAEALAWSKLGRTRWRDEDQYFFFAKIDSELPDRFEHVVTGDGDDRGLRYRYSWLQVSSDLSRDLVQGSNALVDRLIERLHRTSQDGSPERPGH